MASAKQITDIAKVIMEKEYEFDYVGLRVQESDYGVAIDSTIEHKSRHWVDGDMTDEETDGIAPSMQKGRRRAFCPLVPMWATLYW